MFVVALFFVALAIADLVRVVNEGVNTASAWNKWRGRIVKAVPLTAIKIVLVSWQIVTQVRMEASFLPATTYRAMKV